MLKFIGTLLHSIIRLIIAFSVLSITYFLPEVLGVNSHTNQFLVSVIIIIIGVITLGFCIGFIQDPFYWKNKTPSPIPSKNRIRTLIRLRIFVALSLLIMMLMVVPNIYREIGIWIFPLLLLWILSLAVLIYEGYRWKKYFETNVDELNR